MASEQRNERTAADPQREARVMGRKEERDEAKLARQLPEPVLIGENGNVVEVASDESFPASDPPSYNQGPKEPPDETPAAPKRHAEELVARRQAEGEADTGRKATDVDQL